VTAQLGLKKIMKEKSYKLQASSRKQGLTPELG
jgi:hypothetical protein